MQTTQYIKLEQRLVLLAWLNHLFGYKNNRELLQDIREADEGFDAEGHSYVYPRLTSRGGSVRIPTDDIIRYDDNIRAHLRATTSRRLAFKLKYFQHLALLYTEVFPGPLFQRPGQHAPVTERFSGKPQRCQRYSRGGEIYGNRPEETRLLDGDRQRQDADHAPELPAVSAL